ncbi:class I SAM-dependent methyltransferase [Fluviispira vulneris]|uniref:class I SAM-dependent methyltransferase n=1 Tax=Fluviispira vulneris TaxID=2763012 RepID=UPI001646BB49|nr:class I SAM-dependent methyltransferase [Fluviispira vulneris]
MIYETINCDLCGSKSYTKIAKQKDLIYNTTNDIFHVVKCNNCNLKFTNPRPKFSYMNLFYSNNYSFHSKKSFLKKNIELLLNKFSNTIFVIMLNPFKFLHPYFIQRITPKIEDPVKKYLKLNIKNKRGQILDIGCGSGVSTHFFGSKSSLYYYRKFLDVFGCDFSDKARSILDKLNIKSFDSIDSIPNTQKFDIIRMNWSLEHVDKPSLYFKFISEHLYSEGIAIICVPNIDGHVYKMYPNCLELPIHLYHFSLDNIQNYADKNNLKIIDSITFSYPGLYYFSSKYFEELDAYKNMSIYEAWKMNKIMEKTNIKDGNDMIIVLKKE